MGQQRAGVGIEPPVGRMLNTGEVIGRDSSADARSSTCHLDRHRAPPRNGGRPSKMRAGSRSHQVHHRCGSQRRDHHAVALHACVSASAPCTAGKAPSVATARPRAEAADCSARRRTRRFRDAHDLAYPDGSRGGGTRTCFDVDRAIRASSGIGSTTPARCTTTSTPEHRTEIRSRDVGRWNATGRARPRLRTSARQHVRGCVSREQREESLADQAGCW